jgi:hypothetical protein
MKHSKQVSQILIFGYLTILAVKLDPTAKRSDFQYAAGAMKNILAHEAFEAGKSNSDFWLLNHFSR